MEKRNQLTESSISTARLHYQSNQFGKSFAYYLLALKLSPEQKQNLRKEFGDVFREWINELLKQNRNEDIFECYGQALDVFPENEWVHDVMGSHLYKLGFAEEAIVYFQQALKLNPDLHSAQENFNNLSNALVERWHFRMLNDRGRNTAFKEAIQRAITTGKGPVSVLDIGAGTGILSMFAVQAGASDVYACEMSKTMTSIAQDVLRANQMLDKVQLLQMKSTDMRIPEHIPNRVSLVVTETLDSGLLGEGILDTVHHAWTHLLHSPDDQGAGGRVIPSGATVYAMLVECQHIRKSHRVIYKSVGSIDLDLTVVSPSVNLTHAQHLATNVLTAPSEPYTSEDIMSIPGGYTALSHSFKVQDFNFNNPEEIAKLHSQAAPPKSLTVPVVQQGTMDAIVLWFDLHLDSYTCISTSPWSESCWEKAIYPINQDNIKGMSDIKSGDTVYLEVVCKENHLAFQNIEINSDFKIVTESTHMNVETVAGSSLSQNKVAPPNIKEKPTGDIQGSYTVPTNEDSISADENLFQIVSDNIDVANPVEDVCVDGSRHVRQDIGLVEASPTRNKLAGCSLNSLPFPSAMNRPHGSEKIKFKGSMLMESTKSNPVFIMDEKDIFSLNYLEYQFHMCETIKKAVHDMLRQSGSTEVHGLVSSDPARDCQVLDMSEGVSLATVNAADSGATRIHACHQRDARLSLLLHLCKQKGYKLGTADIQTLITEQNSDELWDILIVDVVEPCGLLRQNVWQELALVRDTILKPGGVIIPSGITIYGMCIDSKWILKNSSVISNTRTLDLDIQPFMNSFKVPTHPGIFLSTLQCTQLSTAVELTHLNLRDINSSAEPSTFKIQQERRVTMQMDGCLMAVAYWFDLKLNAGQSVTTFDPTSHFSQAVYILPEQIQVSAGDNICLSFFLEESSISFKVSVLN